MILTSIFAGIGSAIVVASLFEWTLHRWVMHRPVGRFDYAFRAHAVVHHQTFKADATSHLKNEEDKHTIPTAWRNGPVLILCCTLPMLVASIIPGNWVISLAALPTFCAYYGFHEYMRWSMHLPKGRRVEHSWLFRRLNGDHLLHHRYMHENFNAVCRSSARSCCARRCISRSQPGR